MSFKCSILCQDTPSFSLLNKLEYRAKNKIPPSPYSLLIIYMNTYLILIYETVFLLLIATIIFYAQVQKNLPLSLALNKIILLICFLNSVIAMSCHKFTIAYAELLATEATIEEHAVQVRLKMYRAKVLELRYNASFDLNQGVKVLTKVLAPDTWLVQEVMS